MSRPLRPALPGDVTKTRLALLHLRSARELLAEVGAPKALERVRLAIASAEGAVRHAERRRTQP